MQSEKPELENVEVMHENVYEFCLVCTLYHVRVTITNHQPMCVELLACTCDNHQPPAYVCRTGGLSLPFSYSCQ